MVMLFFWTIGTHEGEGGREGLPREEAVEQWRDDGVVELPELGDVQVTVLEFGRVQRRGHHLPARTVDPGRVRSFFVKYVRDSFFCGKSSLRAMGE